MLKAGDKVGVVAPASYIDAERLEKAPGILAAAGLVPVIHPQCRGRTARFAGSDAERVAALHDMYRDPEIKAVWAARGGYGCLRLLDLLDFDLIRRNPKPLVGYSDITALLVALYQRAGVVGVHGRSVGDAWSYANAEADAATWALLKGEVRELGQLAGAAPEVLVPGVSEGPLVGGNLAMLAALCGSPDQLQAQGSILFLEEIGEELYRFDRLLLQLQRAGVFAGVKGVIIGGLTDVRDSSPPEFGKTADEIIRGYVEILGVPVVANYPSGHSPINTPWLYGARVRLEALDSISLKLV